MTASAVLLVADDDPVVRDFLAEVLVREGYQVRAVSGGEECVQVAATEPFDLALVDLRMPDLDGIDVLKRLATLQPGVPVLILTAFVTMETAIEAIQAGAWDYLSKPLRVEEIEVTVRRALEVQRLVRETSTARSCASATASRTSSARRRRCWRSTRPSRASRRTTRPC